MKAACLFVFVFLEGHLSFAENVVNCTVKVSGSFLLVFFSMSALIIAGSQFTGYQ